MSTGGRVAAAVLLLALLAGLAAPLLARSPTAVRTGGRLEPLAAPSAEHVLGTDDVGRDVAARLLYGARTSLALGAAAVALSLAAGLLGALAVAGRRRAAAALGAVTDLVGALPPLVLAVAAQGLLGRASFLSLALLVALPRAADAARLLSVELEAALRAPHLEAARSLGATRARLLWRHALPMCLPQLAVAAAATLATAVLAEAALGFLGLGVRPPTASWGELIAQAHRNALAWWLAVPAGAAVAVVALAASRLADEVGRRARAA